MKKSKQKSLSQILGTPVYNTEHHKHFVHPKSGKQLIQCEKRGVWSVLSKNGKILHDGLNKLEGINLFID